MGITQANMLKIIAKKKKIKFIPALSLKTKVAQVKEIRKGICVSYGCDFVSKKKMKIAILPVGYYDGLDRKLESGGGVLFKRKKKKKKRKGWTEMIIFC